MSTETVPMVSVQNLSKTFSVSSVFGKAATTPVQALDHVSFAMEAGSTWAVVGGSGSGKTTLAKIICRLIQADTGEVLWKNKSLTAYSRQEWAQRIQMVFQDPYASLNPKLSIAFQLNEALRMGKNTSQTAEDLLVTVGLSREASVRYPFQFSGGQRQRIAIARALALNPQLLILDEPLSALDVQTQEQIMQLFQRFRQTMGLSFILITHDLGLAERLADTITVLKDGRIVEQGAAAQVLRAPQHAYTQALVEAIT